ncbi:MAG: hypothetical protein ACM3NJ_00540, partial [Methanobacterium sp.]
MLSGCSPVEKEYYNLIMEAGSQKVYESSGCMEINVAQLPAEIFEDDEILSKEKVQQALNQYRIDYWCKTDLNQGLVQLDMNVVDKTTEEKRASIRMIFRDDTCYIKVDEFISYLKEFCDAKDKQELDKVFGDVEYISINYQDIESALEPEQRDAFKGDILENAVEQQMVWRNFYDSLVYNVYDEYTGSLISKNNNQYTFTLRGSELVENAKPIAIYTLNNIDKLGRALETVLTGLTQEQAAYLGLNSKHKEELLSDIDDMVLDVNQNRSRYLQTIETIPADAQEKINSILRDSEMNSMIEKVDNRTYKDSSIMRIQTILGPGRELDFTLKTKETIKTCFAVDVLKPVKVLTVKELERRMPVTMIVWVDDQCYTLDKGFDESTDGDINAVI